MSRKAEEVKVRVTTLEKGWWQEAAASENTTVSELIRRTMNEQILPRRRDATAATPIAGQIELEPEADVDLRGTDAFAPRPIEAQLDEDDLAIAKLDATPTAGPPNAHTVVTSIPDPFPAATLIEAGFPPPITGLPRRTVACACGKPTFLFCRVCDV